MSVLSAVNSVTYSGNGATTVFSVPYYFLLNTDIQVLVGGVIQTQGVAYNITGAKVPAGGTVTFVAAPVSGTNNVVIQRTVPITNPIDFVNNDTILEGALDDAFDRTTMICQQLDRLVAQYKAALDAIVIAAANVPIPVLGDVGGFLKATGVGVYAWTKVVINDINDAAVFMKTFLSSANLGAARTNLGLADSNKRVLMVVIDGGGVPINTGLKGYFQIPYACTITKWAILADVAGSIVVDIWKDTFANYPPTIADVITASAKPTITAAQAAQSSTLTGWTTAVAAGDVLGFTVNSNATIQRVTMQLELLGS